MSRDKWIRWDRFKVYAEMADEVLMEVERGHKFEPEIEGT
jgi:hypothetical protein